MMKVMGRARVESDRARSAFDSLARLRAVLAMALSAGVPIDDGRCRRRATPRDALSLLTRVCNTALTAGNVTDGSSSGHGPPAQGRRV